MYFKIKIVLLVCINVCGYMLYGDFIIEWLFGKIFFVIMYLVLVLIVFKLGCLGLWLGLGW